jgi:hypothetical protein
MFGLIRKTLLFKRIGYTPLFMSSEHRDSSQGLQIYYVHHRKFPNQLINQLFAFPQLSEERLGPSDVTVSSVFQKYDQLLESNNHKETHPAIHQPGPPREITYSPVIESWSLSSPNQTSVRLYRGLEDRDVWVDENEIQLHITKAVPDLDVRVDSGSHSIIYKINEGSIVCSAMNSAVPIFHLGSSTEVISNYSARLKELMSLVTFMEGHFARRPAGTATNVAHNYLDLAKFIIYSLRFSAANYSVDK